ncbi:MAG: dihydrouridine synthase [Deltaproteobacteria bacterium CG23_combo_of_CG06-09_8_20_14_all_60_8]|nr:MAG: dihydrouridine synthase [Deltaproteobacteria bacterium CG23_combo_of_CG06-09_8_20_14_all_60_8]
MLAPMQGLTNRAMRALLIEWVRPATVFTELIRVRPGARKIVSDADRREAGGRQGGAPLVVQLIGRDPAGLVAGAELAQACGAEHLNINMGCPYGRMHGGSAGGALLKNPAGLAATLVALRQAAHGSFSVKLRAGYDDPEQVFALLPVFEEAGVDFLILHPRTVRQRYTGRADHRITARVVAATRLPVIANGDIMTAAAGLALLAETGAAGLMLGRGAMNDPFLFARLRGEKPAEPSQAERAAELRDFFHELLRRYPALFCGDEQTLRKLKEVAVQVTDPRFAGPIRDLKRAKGLARFADHIEAIL